MHPNEKKALELIETAEKMHQQVKAASELIGDTFDEVLEFVMFTDISEVDMRILKNVAPWKNLKKLVKAVGEIPITEGVMMDFRDAVGGEMGVGL